MPTPSSYTPFRVPTRGRKRVAPTIAMIVCAAATFLLLPFTTLITGAASNKQDIRSIDVSLPPPPPPPLDVEKPPEEPPPQEQPEPQNNPANQLSLSQMDVALNVGFGDAMAGGFSLEGFATQSEATTVADLGIFDIKDLDKPPSRTRTVSPVYPPELKRARLQGNVVLMIIIDQNGRCTVDKVVESTAREFEQSAITAAEQCVFEPPMKGGQAVRARYRMQVPFRL